MNHLEPLFWPSPLQVDLLVTHERETVAQQHLAAMLSLSIRSSFRVIGTYLEACRRSAPPAFLAGSVQAARELGLVTFELAAEPLINTSLRADFGRCLDGLEQLAHSLSAGESLPHWERAHALDSLIALLVQLDSAVAAHAGPWADHSLASHPSDRRIVRAFHPVRVRRGSAASSPADGR